METNFKKQKEKIRKEHFATGGMVVITILGIVGLFFVIISISGIFYVRSTEMLYKYLSRTISVIIIGSIFFLLLLYVWFYYIRNVIINPKKEILYLCEKNNRKFFIDKKGKIFFFERYNKDVNKYYYVLKTKDYIYQILEESTDPNNNFTIQEKNSKIKLYFKNNNIEEDEEKNSYFTEIILIIFKLILVIAILNINISIYKLFFGFTDLISKILCIPFLGITTSLFGCVVSYFFNSYRLVRFFSKLTILIFIIFWFGLITFFIILILKNTKDFGMLLFFAPFITFGLILIVYFILREK